MVEPVRARIGRRVISTLEVNMISVVDWEGGGCDD